MIEIIPNKDVDIDKDIKRFKKQSGFVFLVVSFAYLGLKTISSELTISFFDYEKIEILTGLFNGFIAITAILLVLSALLHLFFTSILPKLIVRN